MIQTIKHRITGATLYESERDTLRAAVEAAVSAGADLASANLAGANLVRANLAGANLAGAKLAGAKLAGANLEGANLVRAKLASASLAGANLAGANLWGAKLEGASLADASLPDGRPWESYRADPLAGICDEPEAQSRAIAAWGFHSWTDCPMAAGLGVHSLSAVDADKRVAVAAFVALFDASLLPVPS